ncbi:MAG: 50S ribosomal protein L22 [Phycisphaeraceae bacterium]
MAYISKYRMARISPTKARPVMDLIRGKRIDEAQVILEMSKLRAAHMIKGVLASAVANADQAEANLRGLVVTDARADAGPTMKRFQPKDRGRAHPILKRTSHLTIAVDTP